jgi:hypothetical protein
MILSVLSKATRSDVCEDPFPHLVIRHALDGELYEGLATAFPDIEVMTPLGTVGKFAYRARDIVADARLGPLWNAFARFHVSDAFYRQVIALFGDYIREIHPDLEARLGKPLEELHTGMRFGEERKDIALEAQCICSQPSSAPMEIIGPHLDRPVALYAGLYYFRSDPDDSTGGDLELYRFRDGRRAYQAGSRLVPERCVEIKRIVRYEKNTLVFFPHSPDAVHGVSTRSASRFPRRHVNLVGEFEIDVYDLSRYPRLESRAAEAASQT